MAAAVSPELRPATPKAPNSDLHPPDSVTLASVHSLASPDQDICQLE